MTLLAGDLTTPQRASIWIANPPPLPSPLLSQLITSMTQLIYSRLNRSRIFQQTFTRTFDGVGNYQLILPDWPLLSVTSVQMADFLVQNAPLPNPVTGVIPGPAFGYGWRIVPWEGNLPGDPAVLEFNNGFFFRGVQNIKVVYVAGYVISNEALTVPANPGPYTVTVNQPLGPWSHDNGVVYASTGAALTAVAAAPAVGQFIPPADSAPGLYTFSAADAGVKVNATYSFIPADLEEACIQMVAERYAYRSRIGEISKSLGGQETVRYLRGGGSGVNGALSTLPPEVAGLIAPYISVIPPVIGAPV